MPHSEPQARLTVRCAPTNAKILKVVMAMSLSHSWIDSEEHQIPHQNKKKRDWPRVLEKWRWMLMSRDTQWRLTAFHLVRLMLIIFLWTLRSIPIPLQCCLITGHINKKNISCSILWGGLLRFCASILSSILSCCASILSSILSCSSSILWPTAWIIVSCSTCIKLSLSSRATVLKLSLSSSVMILIKWICASCSKGGTLPRRSWAFASNTATLASILRNIANAWFKFCGCGGSGGGGCATSTWCGLGAAATAAAAAATSGTAAICWVTVHPSHVLYFIKLAILLLRFIFQECQGWMQLLQHALTCLNNAISALYHATSSKLQGANSPLQSRVIWHRVPSTMTCVAQNPHWKYSTLLFATARAMNTKTRNKNKCFWMATIRCSVKK